MSVAAQEVAQDQDQSPVTADLSAEPADSMTAPETVDVYDAFAGSVDEAIGPVLELGGTPCDRLADVLQSDPALLTRVFDYAASLKSNAEHDQALAGPSVQRSLGDLDFALRQLDTTRASCGV